MMHRCKAITWAVTIRLPKHSQPDDLTKFERIHHHKIPPVFVVDSNSIAVGNLPIKFSWAGSKQRENMADYIHSTHQILQDLVPPLIEQRTLARAMHPAQRK
jgi:hypothetical protein